jgi:signal transduction histidine kinase
MQEKVGVFNVYQVAFPEYLAHYSDMSSVLSYVVGLAIANARKYQSIKDNEEKQKYYALKLEESNFSKDKFFSIIAHDLRGPFGSIVGLLNIFNDNYDNYDDEERRTLLNKTYQTSQNTFRLLENLLHWASSQTGRIPFKPVNMDLHIISNMVIEVLREQAKNKNIRLIQLINLNTMVFADEDMLTSIFRNLIANAIKFSFPGNDVIIKASTDNLFAYISVADTGVGIVEENLQKIFNISENIHTKGTAKEQGTGLGMILCKEFVEKQGGQIKVDSIVDKGTTINFTVPLAKKNIKLNSNSILYDK